MRYVAAREQDQPPGDTPDGERGPQSLGTFESLPLARTACAQTERGTLRWWEGPEGHWQAAGRDHIYHVCALHEIGLVS